MRFFLNVLFFLPLASCEIMEIPRNPTLAPPLALRAYTATLGGTPQAAFRFQAYNNETYFSGFLLYVTTNKEDLLQVDPANRLFALRPKTATLLSNYGAAGDTNLSITYNGAMAKADVVLYPPTAAIDVNSNLQGSTLTGFGGAVFAAGTLYYIGVYSYSIADNRLSLPSVTNFSF